ncbi:MAG: glycine cleavage system protein GcvH [Candidatus Calescibacterium sp.]|jgi:glycine cleavage system H protein
MPKYEVPSDLMYTEEHEWVRITDNFAICGITDYAQKSLSDIIFVELPEIGKIVNKGDVVCTVESVKAVSDVFSPVSGEIIEVNKQLEKEPSFINKSPYGDGWIFKVKISDIDFSHLLTPEKYLELLQKIEEGR